MLKIRSKKVIPIGPLTAARWWSDQIRQTVRGDNVDERLEVFEETLAKSIAREIRRELRCEPFLDSITVRVRHHPDRLLFKAAQKAGIQARFPKGTRMIIYADFVDVQLNFTDDVDSLPLLTNA